MAHDEFTNVKQALKPLVLFCLTQQTSNTGMADSNVIILGDTAGRASVVNILMPFVDSRAGRREQYTLYKKNIRDKCFNIFDTVGLIGGKAGTVSQLNNFIN